MSVKQHPKDPEKWIIDYWEVPPSRKKKDRGKRVRVTLSGTREDADQVERDLRKMHNRPVPVNPRINDVLSEYLSWLKMHRSECYYEDIDKSLKWLKPHFGNVQFSKITPQLVNEYKKKRPGTKYKGARAINKELGFINAIVNWAVRHGYANPLPFKIEKLPYKRPLPKVPHPNDIEKFLNALSKYGHHVERKKALILFMWECGLRWKEARLVKWENIDWDNNIVHLEDTKGDTPRICILMPRIRELLEPIKKDSGWVFENRRTGEPWKAAKTLFTNTAQRAKIKHIYPHLLRHGFSTYTLEATGDIKMVKELMGHRDIRTTEIYAKIATSRFKEAVQKTTVYMEELRRQKTEKKQEDKK